MSEAAVGETADGVLEGGPAKSPATVAGADSAATPAAAASANAAASEPAPTLSEPLLTHSVYEGAAAAIGLGDEMPVSILKARIRPKQPPYQPPAANERSEHELKHGRNPARRVQIVLPEGYREKTVNRRNTITRGGKKRPSRRGLSLFQLRASYESLCQQTGTSPLAPIINAFEEAEANKSRIPPPIFDLSTVRTISNDQFGVLCDIIVNNAALRVVEMPELNLRDRNIERLAQALVFRRSVERLNLAGNSKIGREGIRYISVVMARSVFLSYLNLSSIPFTPKMAHQLKESLPASRIRTLIMHSCGLKNQVSLAAVVSGCAGCQPLTNLSFKSNDISAEGARWIADLLSVDNLLSCLDLRCNNLGDAGAALLAVALMENIRLEKLVLYENHIGSRGAIALAQGLYHNNTLESLDLSANEIGSHDAMVELKDMLLRNRSLRNLYLWKTGMDDEGTIALAETLAENPQLLRLELRHNTIGLAGLLALRHAMKMNDLCFKLLLDAPNMTDDATQEYASMLYTEIQRKCGENLSLEAEPQERARQEAMQARFDMTGGETVNEGAEQAAAEAPGAASAQREGSKGPAARADGDSSSGSSSSETTPAAPELLRDDVEPSQLNSDLSLETDLEREIDEEPMPDPVADDVPMLDLDDEDEEDDEEEGEGDDEEEEEEEEQEQEQEQEEGDDNNRSGDGEGGGKVLAAEAPSTEGTVIDDADADDADAGDADDADAGDADAGDADAGDADAGDGAPVAVGNGVASDEQSEKSSGEHVNGNSAAPPVLRLKGEGGSDLLGTSVVDEEEPEYLEIGDEAGSQPAAAVPS